MFNNTRGYPQLRAGFGYPLDRLPLGPRDCENMSYRFNKPTCEIVEDFVVLNKVEFKAPILYWF